MAYNNISGTVLLPSELIKVEGVNAGIVSGNLSTSDGADVINVPRVSLPNADSLVINVGGDPNTLKCDTKLTFDGDTLNITGDLTASLAISASYFEGDGSRLTGITAGGSGGGIFTEASTNQAFTTSSVNIGSNATPTHTLSVVGTSHLSGGLIHNRIKKTGNYTVTTSDYIVGVDTTSSPVTLTFPAAAAALDGQVWLIKDEGGSASSNKITITGSDNSNTIEGQNSIVLESNNASIHIYCDGATKYFVV